MAKYETRGRKVAVGGCARAEQLGIDSPHCLRRCNNGIDDFPLSSLHQRAKSRGRAHCYCAREGTNCSRDVPQTAGGLESTADPGKSRTRRGRALTKADPESLPGELGISYHPRLGGGQDFPGDASPLAGNERRRNPSSESSHSSDRPLARLKRERESREGRSLPATIKRLILKVRSRARLIGPSPPPPPLLIAAPSGDCASDVPRSRDFSSARRSLSPPSLSAADKDGQGLADLEARPRKVLLKTG